MPIGEIHGRGPDPWAHYQRSGSFTPYTAIVNVTGQPAISVPLYHGDDGLPTAVQLIGRPTREDTLLALAAQLERARPWAHRRPEIAADCDASADAEHGGHRLRQHAEPLGVRGPVPRGHRDLEQLGLVPGGERGRAEQQLGCPQPARASPGSARATIGRRRPNDRSAISTTSR